MKLLPWNWTKLKIPSEMKPFLPLTYYIKLKASAQVKLKICTLLFSTSWLGVLVMTILKVAFFQKVRCVFQISKKNIPKNYPELEI